MLKIKKIKHIALILVLVWYSKGIKSQSRENPGCSFEIQGFTVNEPLLLHNVHDTYLLYPTLSNGTFLMQPGETFYRECGASE
jgi:hypothetical protein